MTVCISAQDFHTYFKPSRCQRRVHLIHHPPPDSDAVAVAHYYAHAAEADRHVERYYFKRLNRPEDLSQLPEKERLQASMDAVLRQEPVIYKPLFSYTWKYKGRRHTLQAEPDFLIWGEDGYSMRHCRMAKKISRDNHPDIFWISQFHGWVYSQIFGEPPVALEVGNATGEISTLPLLDETRLTDMIWQLVTWRQSRKMPYHPVSWTKCQSCHFRDFCWQLAEASEDISLVPNLESALILDLRAQGITTVSQLREQHTVDSLARYEWIESQTPRKIGAKKAQNMLHMAESILTQKPILTQQPRLPESNNWLMFDVEAVPARPGQPEKVYLWGLYLMGEQRENLQLISQTLNRQADRDNWFAFLERMRGLFDTYGDLPLIHWGNFESACIKLYVKRFGDRRGVARRIQRNLLDFFEVLKASVVVPIPSYSLKVLEKYVGFVRPDEDTGGYWSVVNYLKAASTKNQARREEIMQQLLAYNCADLEAMWAVMCWFQDLLHQNQAA